MLNETLNQNNILKGYNMLLYFAGTMLMYEPSEECIFDFWKNGILKALPVSSSNPNFIKAASQLRESCQDISNCRERMQEDYVMLFSRPDLPLAPAFGSYYLLNGHLSSENKASSVTEFYKSYGWVSKFQGKKSDDHLGVELLFLTILIDKYLVFDDEACSNEMRKEIQRFIDLHLYSWIPQWNDRVQTYSNTLCYKGIGTLTLACIEDIYSFLGQDIKESFPEENLKN